MEKYKLKDFAKWAKREGLSDDLLHEALGEMSKGLVGDRLGGSLYKKRVALSGRGKRGGARTILIFKQNEVAVFLFGYAKNERDDLEPNEEESLKIFAKAFLRWSADERAQRIKDGSLILIEEH